jgi:hypothetical protein
MATEDLQINIGANTQDLQTGLNQATQSVTNFGTAVKNNLKPTADATNALTNLSRVAQDAPYGFMGIANNLNPLLESFQRLSKESGGAGSALKALVGGLTGPAGIGLALGAASSLLVAFGDDIVALIGSETELEKTNKELRASFLDNLKGVETVIATDEALIGVINDVTISTEARNAALKQLKEAHKGNVELQKTDINDGEQLIKVIDRMSEALVRKAQIEGTAKIIGEKYAELVRLQTADIEEQVSDLSGWSMAWDVVTGSVKGLGNNLGGVNIGMALTGDAIENNGQKADKTKKVIDSLKGSLAELTKVSFQSGDYNVTGTSAPKSAGAKQKEQVDTSDLETLKKKQQLYKEDAYAFKQYADLITKEEERIALEKARINKASANEIQNIKEQASIGLQKNALSLGNSLDKIFKAADDKYIKDQKEFEKEKLSNQLQASKDSLEIVKRTLDLENKLAGDSYEKRKEALQKAMAETKILMALSSNPKAVQELDKAYKDMDKQYKMLDIDGKQKETKKLQDNYKKFAETIANDVTQGFMVMFDAMSKGENPLKALGNFLMDLVKQFAAAIIQATIFKGIMSLLNVATGGGTGFFGSVIGGVGKLLGMAEGGIVSRPTLAMVGEGGQNEAVMPLNKLGNMMNSTFAAGAMSGMGGGGNGQFVLKGNDLVLALQRSNYSLNLRRGNGI